MKNVFRALICNDQVSLTLIDTTPIVREAVKLHSLSVGSAVALGKVLSVVAYMSSALKEETGEVSVTLKGDGSGGSIGVSGDYALHIRGYIENTNAAWTGSERTVVGEQGSLTVVRDDGYSRPFVGACELSSDGVDETFETYYHVSEQLPTFLSSVVRFDEDDALSFAGIAVLQPLPFADGETIEKLPKGTALREIVSEIRELGVSGVAEKYFSVTENVAEGKEAVYQCHCSREYIAGVLSSLGKTQMQEIIDEDGEVKVHCHYCNTDYIFLDEDVEKIFPEKR